MYLAAPGSPGVFKRGVAEWFILAAVGISETSRKDLAEDLSEIKDYFFPGWRARPWGETEIKGSYLRAAHKRLAHRRRPAKPTGYHRLTVNRLDRLIHDLGSLFRKFRPHIYVVAIDK